MKQPYSLFKRGSTFYLQDARTGKQPSLNTKDRSKAQRLVNAENEAINDRLLNLALGQTYLRAHNPQISQRTWGDLLKEFGCKGKESTRQRQARAIKSKDFDPIRNLKVVETTTDDFLAVLKKCGSYTNHVLHCDHGLALGYPRADDDELEVSG
jgi:hypothetical protein